MSNIPAAFTKHHVPVLIVGGGISGLSAALFLLKQGVQPLLVERHRGTSIHPRARGFDIRTMELFRELGLSEPIREAGKALGPSWGIYHGPSLAMVLKRVKRRQGEAITHPVQLPGMEKLSALSPEAGARCTQDLSEPVLLAAALERGADIQFNTELTGFQQSDFLVTATLKDRETGKERAVTADYMIAADGANSPIREALKASATGDGPLGNLLNIYFEADLADFVRHREFSMLIVDEKDCKGILTSINNQDRWVFHLHYDPSKEEKAADYTAERLQPLLEKIIGLPDLKIRIISILPWQPTVRVVDNMQHGRIFLAGDAAHVMTPYGGKGAATGVQDVHNLAWKLAAVLQGRASSALLQTYSIERQPVGLDNALQSRKMAGTHGLPRMKGRVHMLKLMKVLGTLGLKGWLQKQMLPKIKGMLGIPEYVYRSSAIIDGEPLIREAKKTLQLNAKPGTRVPHVWVEYQHRKTSTLDFTGKDFILLTGKDNASWQKAVAAAAHELHMNIPVYDIGKTGSLIFADSEIHEVFGISDRGAVLVRPDGFVAWRSPGDDVASAGTLKKKLRQILSN